MFNAIDDSLLSPDPDPGRKHASAETDIRMVISADKRRISASVSTSSVEAAYVMIATEIRYKRLDYCFSDHQSPVLSVFHNYL